MPYFIETYDKPGRQSLRQRVRPAHLQYLEMNKNKLLASGAKLDDAGANASGGIYIGVTPPFVKNCTLSREAELTTAPELLQRGLRGSLGRIEDLSSVSPVDPDINQFPS